MAMICTGEVDAGGQCDGDHVGFVRGPGAYFHGFPSLQSCDYKASKGLVFSFSENLANCKIE